MKREIINGGYFSYSLILKLLILMLNKSFLDLIQKHQNYQKHKLAANKKNHKLAVPANLWFISQQNKKTTKYVLVETVGVEPTSKSIGT
ncbi:hypothetical protein [Bacillus sp. FJAT-53711]|uniref:hypothetical protein n=1 Tax=Bacillus yunxiaonensis TaxID=3127665 RepID=UPI003013C53A